MLVSGKVQHPDHPSPMPSLQLLQVPRLTSTSLAESLGQAVREAAAKNVDETGWKQAGRKRWLWGAATATVAFFVIHARLIFDSTK